MNFRDVTHVTLNNAVQHSPTGRNTIVHVSAKRSTNPESKVVRVLDDAECENDSLNASREPLNGATSAVNAANGGGNGPNKNERSKSGTGGGDAMKVSDNAETAKKARNSSRNASSSSDRAPNSEKPTGSGDGNCAVGIHLHNGEGSADTIRDDVKRTLIHELVSLYFGSKSCSRLEPPLS